jgi:hypothetical protein
MSGGLYYSDGAKLNEEYNDDFEWYNKNYLKTEEILNSPFDNIGYSQKTALKPLDLSRFSYFVDAKFRYKKRFFGSFCQPIKNGLLQVSDEAWRL